VRFRFMVANTRGHPSRKQIPAEIAHSTTVMLVNQGGSAGKLGQLCFLLNQVRSAIRGLSFQPEKPAPSSWSGQSAVALWIQ
jgi:hypothetical protein